MIAAPLLRMLALLGRGIGQGSMFGVKLTGKSLKNLRVALDQPARAKAVMRMSTYVAADQMFYGVVGRIPGGPKWGHYRKQIQLARYGSEGKAVTYVVYAKPSATTKAIDTVRSVLYVRPKKNFMGKVRKEVLILAKYSPWTAETLPFSPLKNEAVIVTRKVTKHEVHAITKAREKDRPEWHRMLTECGVRNVNMTKKLPELKAKVVQDLAFDALRMEFGYGGAKAIPHWRPSVQEALQYTKRLFKSRSIFSKAMTDPNFRAWRNWPPKVESSIKINTLKSTEKFSKRLKVRV